MKIKFDPIEKFIRKVYGNYGNNHFELIIKGDYENGDTEYRVKWINPPENVNKLNIKSLEQPEQREKKNEKSLEQLEHLNNLIIKKYTENE